MILQNPKLWKCVILLVAIVPLFIQQAYTYVHRSDKHFKSVSSSTDDAS